VRGIAFKRKADCDHAIADFSRWIEKDSNNASDLERDDFSSSRHPALSFCLSMIFSEKPVPTFPDHALAYALSGDAYMHQNDYDRAVADFTKQIEIDPNYPDAYRSRSAAYAGKPNNDAALADNNKAIELTKLRLESGGFRPQ